MSLTITENYINEILVEAGFPIVSLDDLELSQRQIIDSLIWPAVRVYFKWFPLQSESSHTVTTTFTIPFPNANTFGVVDARLNTAGFEGLERTAHPLVNEINIKAVGGGVYGTKNTYNFSQAEIMEQMERRSFIDTQKVIRIKVDESSRQITGYTNIYGQVSIIWADYSEDFDDVQFSRLDEVIKLARANVLRYLGMLRNQDSGDLPNELDGNDFITRANDLEEKIMETWKKFSKVVLLRG